MFGLIFLISSLMLIDSLDMWEAKKCYKSFCYTWSGEKKPRNELPFCQEMHWDLEIYEPEVENEVIDFIKYLILFHGKKDSIQGMFINLNVGCLDLNRCYWKKNNNSLKFDRWDVDFFDGNKFPYIEADPNMANKWRMTDQTDFTKICMSHFSPALVYVFFFLLFLAFTILCVVMGILEELHNASMVKITKKSQPKGPKKVPSKPVKKSPPKSEEEDD